MAQPSKGKWEHARGCVARFAMLADPFGHRCMPNAPLAK
jgi:hypothetical protein